MQATIATFDPVTRAGTVLLDDGTELTFGGQAFDEGHLLVARLGQRVRVHITGSGSARHVSALTLASFSLPPGRGT